MKSKIELHNSITIRHIYPFSGNDSLSVSVDRFEDAEVGSINVPMVTALSPKAARALAHALILAAHFAEND